MLIWTRIDVDSLPKKLARKLEKVHDYGTTREERNTAREKFDEALIKALKRKVGKPPAKHKYMIGHNFGMLSFAAVPKALLKHFTR